jgi:hypothetical protein
MFRSLRSIKVIHTVIWAFFVACILGIPYFTALSRLGLAAVFAGIVAVEVVVLAANRMSCPLTGVAEQYTDDRRANFDIYLPEWLARQNKTIFGSLYIAGVLYLLARWLTSA